MRSVFKGKWKSEGVGCHAVPSVGKGPTADYREELSAFSYIALDRPEIRPCELLSKLPRRSRFTVQMPSVPDCVEVLYRHLKPSLSRGYVRTHPITRAKDVREN